jgi:cytochrome b subunit of formate dehydrogenase
MNKISRGVMTFLILGLGWLASAQAAEASSLDNPGCLSCHSDKKRINVPGRDGEPRDLYGINRDKYDKGVHARLACVDCHTDIQDNRAPHRRAAPVKVDCVECHERLWEAAKKDGTAAAKPNLEKVVKNAKAHSVSFHALPRKDNPSRVNARCDECHNTHTFVMPPPKKKGSDEYDEWRRAIPALCGTNCHEKQFKTYAKSVHGDEVINAENAKAAVCIDCHTNHEVEGVKLDAFKLILPEECGQCHRKNLKSYRGTFHGQITKLGYAHTAKCYDCHGSHDIFRVDEPESKVHPNNRLNTCKTCHDGKQADLATAGFETFGPHAHANDYKRYPQMYIASRFMIALLIGVFAFFWLHSGLWYFREWMDRRKSQKQGKVPLIDRRKAGVTARWRPRAQVVADHAKDEMKHVKRFALGWRIAHLLFALLTMTLVLTGTSIMYAHSTWAPEVVKALGGAITTGIIHRVAATLFIGIFFVHFVTVMYHLLVKQRGQFKWFGPDSLIPRWQDFKDCWGMFKWFAGKGSRPSFDRWAYYEKFDYWAVFWGVTVIGTSGLMLAFPSVTATYLPGWVFNVAVLVHGEEAFLAAVFLFTVHFFNNHFRPDKLPPPDIVMFTGTQSLEEFRREHAAQYERLVASGELEKCLVDPPTAPLRRGSKILGLTLIGIGLTLLVLVIMGFVQGLQ